MDALKANLDTTAMIIGYPVLAIVLLLMLWFGTRIFQSITKIFDEMRYERWRRRHAERDWGNIEASWALELDPEIEGDEYFNRETDEFATVQYQRTDTDELSAIPAQRHDTLELSQLFNYQEENNERS